MENAFRDGEIKTAGTDIDKLMPPISRFGGGGRAMKKQGVIDKMKGFFEKYFGIGGSSTFVESNHKVAVKRDFSAGPKTSWKEKWEATRQALPCIGLPIIVVGGIMGGFFTPTEAAAAAVLYSLILSAFVYRTVGWKELWKSIIDSAIDSGTVMLIVGGCYLFGWVISNERWAVSVTNMLVGLHTSLAVKLLLVNLVLLVVGMFMDSAPAIMLVAPILAPAMASLGVDPIQTGMIVCLNLTIGLATPPVGVCLYTATNIARCKFGDTVRNAVPFLVAMLAALAIITNVPVVSRIPFILMGR